ncbi:DUF4834 family protein [Alloprevotella tannerae]|uniref:DUF4834 family protein n=1 Tax=Alloprevotella tannerae TaxID=76122 RepID=UPI0028E739EB|nr:DUF4834 family protein [Alloprevotella tannerae]
MDVFFILFFSLIALLLFFLLSPIIHLIRQFQKIKKTFYQQTTKAQERRSQSSQEPRQQAQTKKIFTPDEGEYVDFEEITDESKSQ